MPDIFELIRQRCPGGVPLVAIKNLGPFEHGVGLGKSMLRSEGDIPVIHYGEIYTTYNLKTDKTVSFLEAGTAVSVSARHGDVVVCLTETANLGFVGKAVAQICGVDVAVSGDAGVLHLNPDEADAVFVSHIMNTEWFQIQKEKCKRGTTVMHLAVSLWQKIRIPLPPLEVQREIVAILDKFDAYCNDMTAGLAGELEMRRKQYRYWREEVFRRALDGVTNVQRLDQCCHLEKGVTPISKAVPGPYPMVTTAKGGATSDTYQFTEPTVCIPLVSSRGHSVAYISRLYYREGEFALGSILCGATPKNHNELSARYLFLYLSYIRNTTLTALMKGAANVAMTVKDLNPVKIPIPDMNTQKWVISVLDKFYELERELERELELRRKQYSYYRDMLLAFPEKKGA